MLYYDVFLLSNYLYFQCQKQKQFSYMISESHLNVLIVFLFKVMDVCNCESVNIVNIGILMYKYWTVNLFVNNHIEIHDEPEVFVCFFDSVSSLLAVLSHLENMATACFSYLEFYFVVSVFNSELMTTSE